MIIDDQKRDLKIKEMKAKSSKRENKSYSSLGMRESPNKINVNNENSENQTLFGHRKSVPELYSFPQIIYCNKDDRKRNIEQKQIIVKKNKKKQIRKEIIDEESYLKNLSMRCILLYKYS